jgi:hypothetical protein
VSRGTDTDVMGKWSVWPHGQGHGHDGQVKAEE